MGSAFAVSALCIFKSVWIVPLIKEVIRAIYLFFCSWRIPSSTILFWVYSICLRWSWRKFVFDAVVISLTRVSLDWYGWYKRRYSICLKRKNRDNKRYRHYKRAIIFYSLLYLLDSLSLAIYISYLYNVLEPLFLYQIYQHWPWILGSRKCVQRKNNIVFWSTFVFELIKFICDEFKLHVIGECPLFVYYSLSPFEYFCFFFILFQHNICIYIIIFLSKRLFVSSFMNNKADNIYIWAWTINNV